jgi:hypothetical protein
MSTAPRRQGVLRQSLLEQSLSNGHKFFSPSIEQNVIPSKMSHVEKNYFCRLILRPFFAEGKKASKRRKEFLQLRIDCYKSAVCVFSLKKSNLPVFDLVLLPYFEYSI